MPLGHLQTREREAPMLPRKSRWIQNAQNGLVPGIRIEERVDEATNRIEYAAIEVEAEEGGAYRTGEARQELLRWEDSARRS